MQLSPMGTSRSGRPCKLLCFLDVSTTIVRGRCVISFPTGHCSNGFAAGVGDEDVLMMIIEDIGVQ
jgi:hypothetical protein